ncbi:MAG: hypothetical protein AB7O67_18550 [Vicinamibacterales bacterium]
MHRRTLLSSLAATAAVLTPRSLFAARPQSGTSPAGAPGRHAIDDWLDKAGRVHRVVFDTWVADRFGEAVGFAGNWMRVNKSEYGLTDADLGLVIVVRHGTGPFAFNEAMWTKYGQIFAGRMSALNPEKHPNPTTNVHAERLKALAGQGMHLAVCNLTTRAYTQLIAEATSREADAVYQELTSNTVGPATFVPAGIVAVTRAQERGYSLVSIG